MTIPGRGSDQDHNLGPTYRQHRPAAFSEPLSRAWAVVKLRLLDWLRRHVRVEVYTPGRCAICELPLDVEALGPTYGSHRGPVHWRCIPAATRAAGSDAISRWLLGSSDAR